MGKGRSSNWASQVVLVAENHLPVQETQETWAHSLDWEDSLEEGMATHSSILEILMNMGAWQAAVHGVVYRVEHD